MNLFDEPEKAISSESKASEYKEDELKKIIDDATKDMEHEHPTPKDLEVPSQPIGANATMQGEGSTSTSSSQTLVQGKTKKLEVSLEPPF